MRIKFFTSLVLSFPIYKRLSPSLILLDCVLVSHSMSFLGTGWFFFYYFLFLSFGNDDSHSECRLGMFCFLILCDCEFVYTVLLDNGKSSVSYQKKKKRICIMPLCIISLPYDIFTLSSICSSSGVPKYLSHAFWKICCSNKMCRWISF